METRTMIYLFLIVSISVYSAELETLGRYLHGDTIQCCTADQRFIDCSFLTMNHNYSPRSNDVFVWDMVKTHEVFSFGIQKSHPVIFKYTPLAIQSNSFYSRLAISSNHLIYLIGVDFSSLKPAQLFPNDKEDYEKDVMINGQNIVFDFTSNQIKQISWRDIFAMYSYLLGLADNFSAFFIATHGVAFVFNDNPLSITTRIKFHFLRLILRLRLLFYDRAFVKYRYVDW